MVSKLTWGINRLSKRRVFYSAASTTILAVAKRLVAGFTTTTQGTAHRDAFLALLVVNAQVAAELQRTVFYSGNRDCLRAVNRHPI